jgi:branched-chain amino acid transport system substrate-binding protein
MRARALIFAGAGTAMAMVAAACGADNSEPTSGPPARPLASEICSPMSYGRPGRPRFLIVNSSGYQGPHKGHGVQTAQAMKMVLADRGWRAGPYTIGMQTCEETSARTGQPSAEKCRRNARAFAEDRSVLGVVGPLYSSCAANMLATLNRAPGGPLAVISGSNTYVGLTRAGPGAAPGEPGRYVPTGQRSYARMAPTDDIQGAADALVAGRLGVRRAFVLDDRSPYGTALAGTFRAAAGRAGVSVVGTAAWVAGARDYHALARRVREAHPNAVFVAGDLAANGPQLIAALTEVLGPDVQLIAGDAFAQPAPLVEAAGSRVDGMIVSIAVLPNESLPPRGRLFAAEFEKRYTQRPCCYSVHDAQATEILLDAIAKAGGSRARVARYVIGARVHNGLLGDFHIDRNGDTTLNTIGVYQIRAGRLRFKQAITPAQELLSRS